MFISVIPPVIALSPQRTASPLEWAFRALLWLLFLLWSLLVLAWLALHWAILPHIQQWRPQIEARASQALGAAVNIGHIEVRSSGWVPALELRDVVLRDAQGRPALSLPRVATALSPRSLLALELRLEQLLIEGAHLEVRRDTDGRVFVAGLDLSGPGGDNTDAVDWLVRQHEIVIRGGSLRWTDERRQAAPLQLDNVQLVVRNGLRRHDLRLDATPPPEWGERFTLRARFTHGLLERAGDWQRWSGAVHAELPRADLGELRRYVALPFELSEGIGALRAWVDVIEGQAQGGTADVALRSVALRLAPNVAPLALEQLEGRVVGQRTADGLTIALHDFGFLAGDGTRWPAGELNLSLRQRAGEPSTGGQFSAQRLDLHALAQVAASLPLGDAVRRLLAEVKPQGALNELVARWTGPLDAPTQYQLNGALSGLFLASRASNQPHTVGRPGLRNASVQLTANQTGGSAMLGLVDGAIELPGVFEELLLPLDRLSAQLLWKIDAGSLSVEVKDARFANSDAQGDLSGAWRTGAGKGLARGGRFPGQIELNGKLDNAVATRLARYLPLHIPEPTRRYVERAVKGGSLSGISLRVKGDLWDFPFFDAASKGEFRIAARAEDVGFAYVPNVPADAVHPAYESPWPALSRIRGDIVLDRSALQIRNAQGQLGQTQWSQMHGGIQDFTDRPVFSLNSTAQGALAEMLRLVNATPVGTWVHQSLAQATGTGPAELMLDLAIPLQDLQATEVRGSISLAGNDVRITPASPLLEGARGRVDFSHQGFAVVGATARAHGGEIAFEGGSQPDSTIRFTGQGKTTAEALRNAPEFGLLSRVAGWLTGQTDYRLELGFVQGHPEINVTSDLIGLASTLPAPLAKAAATPLAMRYQTRVARESLAAGQALRDTLRFDLGAVVQTQFQRDLSGDAARVLRGGIGLMEPAPTPASGVKVGVNLDSVNVDDWQVIQGRLFGAANAVGSESVEPGGYAPNALTVRAQELVFLSRRLNNVVAGLTLDKGQWRANLDADQLDGYVEYRPPGPGATSGSVLPGRVFARLSRLSLPPSEVDDVEKLLDEQPSAVPALDIVVNDFELRGKRLGRLEIDASHRLVDEGTRPVREWRLAKFNLLTPEARLNASGQWSLGAGGARGRRAVMDFKLALADSGAYLERLGMGKVVRGGKGQISGQLAWQGSPLTIDYASLTGQASVEIDSGQFLKADAGAARLLGVLSLQSLPRRLSLDFRDLFEEGFAFDSFGGDVRITEGVAHTNNLRMRGAQAAALMEGQADLARETQDLRVVVVPQIDAGTASLAYAIINPAVGLGTFLAQLFLRKPFSQAGTREFHVRGSWADPTVDRVERKAGAPVPDIDALESGGPPAAVKQ